MFKVFTRLSRMFRNLRAIVSDGLSFFAAVWRRRTALAAENLFGVPGRAVKLRNNPSLVRYVRSFLCCQAEAAAAQAGRQMVLDEVFLKINGVQHYLWRAVDQTGAVIDILVQPKRDRFAAMR